MIAAERDQGHRKDEERERLDQIDDPHGDLAEKSARESGGDAEKDACKQTEADTQCREREVDSGCIENTRHHVEPRLVRSERVVERRADECVGGVRLLRTVRRNGGHDERSEDEEQDEREPGREWHVVARAYARGHAEDREPSCRLEDEWVDRRRTFGSRRADHSLTRGSMSM